jgi:hypothetical protein
MLLCATLAAIFFAIGLRQPFSPIVLGVEVLLTILSLFVFGSAKYQIHKNALTYGSVLIALAIFVPGWWEKTDLRLAYQAQGLTAFLPFLRHHLLTFHGLDELIHADTMLFILGPDLFCRGHSSNAHSSAN